MKAAHPPAGCASAITCSAMVVLPDDSGPKTSITRPRGNPPTPSAASSEMEPLEITLTGSALREPKLHDRALAKLLLHLKDGLHDQTRAIVPLHVYASPICAGGTGKLSNES